MTATITSLAGAIGQLLTRNDSDADQLADVATVLRIVKEAVRDEQAIERIDWLLLDLEHFAMVRAESEALSEYHEQQRMRRN